MACGPRDFCGRGESREGKQGGNSRFPADGIHGSASKPKALWCLSCSAEVDWACSHCSETSRATQGRQLTLSSLLPMETSPKAERLLRTMYKIMQQYVLLLIVLYIPKYPGLSNVYSLSAANLLF